MTSNKSKFIDVGIVKLTNVSDKLYDQSMDQWPQRQF